MYVTITRNRTSPQRTPRVEAFLSEFLPRLRLLRRVRAIHHLLRPEHGDDMTIIVWDNEDAAKAYRTSDLVREATAFERSQRAVGSEKAIPCPSPCPRPVRTRP